MKTNRHYCTSNHVSRTLNKRKMERIVVDNGIYALLSWPGHQKLNKLGQLIDITPDGIGFYYVADENTDCVSLKQPVLRLKIISIARMFELEKFTVVYDIEVSKYPTVLVSVRRCGIKFGQLSQQRKADIERIINLGCHEASLSRNSGRVKL